MSAAINSPKLEDGDRRRWWRQRQRTGALTAGVESGTLSREKERRLREGSAPMNNSPLLALLLLLIFAYAQGNDMAAPLGAPPSADLHSSQPGIHLAILHLHYLWPISLSRRFCLQLFFAFLRYRLCPVIGSISLRNRRTVDLRYGGDTARTVNPTLQLNERTPCSWLLSSRNFVTGTEWCQKTLK